ncbi:MAG: 2,3,4,5-tetrahydropyridine-2,6-dicarboxylate N-succinyltransferase [Bdellovibrionales bacterium]|nr:2,3,4,5-tetrahydropyridine-2,6-dicarboxylate N-succinyltransferase [Bdellovibrionales bacterium]
MKEIIHEAFEGKLPLQDKGVIDAILQTIALLDEGKIRVCDQVEGKWLTNAWIKEAILLYFRIQKMTVIQAGDLQFYDKVPLKKFSEKDGVRVVPSALVRQGAFVEKGAILMPSYVNIGAYVGSGTMVDTWATVGSCAQIGSNVHLSGGVGIGGVLEPVQASPVIIENDVFVGSRCIVVEGAHIETGSVLGAGVTITASTKIIDVSGSKEVVHQGFVPKNSVVIPGSITKKFPAGEYGVNCALIIGSRKESTDKKTSLTQALREFQVSV